MQLLSKGLQFVPSPSDFNGTDKIELYTNILEFNRRLRLKLFFQNREDTTPRTPNPFRESSGWTPPVGYNTQFERFVNCVTQDALDHTPAKVRPNLTRQQKSAIKSLKENPDITIKPADKGGAIVIWNTTDYVKEATRQLSRRDHYEVLLSDPTNKYCKEITGLIKTSRDSGNMSAQDAKYLLSFQPRLATFYMLPKIHKKDVPGRPIVSACGCPTERISAYVDYHLKPLVEKTTSYIKDSTDFLNKLTELNIPTDAILCTLDVSSLYTNIPHTEGLRACYTALDSRQEPDPPTWLLVQLLEKVLKLNAFDFNGKVYHQTQGTSMGTKCAPNYANLFMAQLESELLEQCHTPLPLIWLRFIDDIFMVWVHSLDELHEFLEYVNDFHQTIKFTVEQSMQEIHFLDITIYKDDTGLIQTRLYSKPTDAHLYLHYSSGHHKSTKEAIPYSQALRARRICSTDLDFHSALDNMMEHFLKRGYPRRILAAAFNKASSHLRGSLLTTKPKVDKEGTLIITKYRQGGYNPMERMKPFLPILESHGETKKLVQSGIITGRRRGANLKDLLVSSRFLKCVTLKGSHPCGKPCATCPLMAKTTTFTSTTTSEVYPIRGSYNCQTSNAVYLITCNKCHLQYIGQTRNTINTRFRGHVNDVRRQDQMKPVGTHFSLHDHSIRNVTITVLSNNDNWNVSQRLRTEESYIGILSTLQPAGLNIIE